MLLATTAAEAQQDIPTETSQSLLQQKYDPAPKRVAGSIEKSNDSCSTTLSVSRGRVWTGFYSEPLCGYWAVASSDCPITTIYELFAGDTIATAISPTTSWEKFYSDDTLQFHPEEIWIDGVSPVIPQVPEHCFNGVKDARERWADCGCECQQVCDVVGVYPASGTSKINLEGPYVRTVLRMTQKGRWFVRPDSLDEEFDYDRNDNGAGVPEVVDYVTISLLDSNKVCLGQPGVKSLVTYEGSIFGQRTDRIQEVDPNGKYYILIEHENHMRVLSPTPVEVLQWNGAYPTIYYLQYDFSTQGGYATDTGASMKWVTRYENNPDSEGRWVMYAGDINYDGDINGQDKIPWTEANGIFLEYLPADFDFDRDIKGDDKALWFNNFGNFSAASGCPE